VPIGAKKECLSSPKLKIPKGQPTKNFRLSKGTRRGKKAIQIEGTQKLVAAPAKTTRETLSRCIWHEITKDNPPPSKRKSMDTFCRDLLTNPGLHVTGRRKPFPERDGQIKSFSSPQKLGCDWGKKEQGKKLLPSTIRTLRRKKGATQPHPGWESRPDGKKKKHGAPKKNVGSVTRRRCRGHSSFGRLGKGQGASPPLPPVEYP